MQWGCLKDLLAPLSEGLGLGRRQIGGLETALGVMAPAIAGAVTETACLEALGGLGWAPLVAGGALLPATDVGNPAFPSHLWHNMLEHTILRLSLRGSETRLFAASSFPVTVNLRDENT